MTRPMQPLTALVSAASLHLFIAMPAFAQDAETGEDTDVATADEARSGLRWDELSMAVGGAGVLEVWQDTDIGATFGSSRVTIALTASVDLPPRWSAEVEVGYARVRPPGATETADEDSEETTSTSDEDTASLEMVPMSLLLGVTQDIGKGQLRLGLGPALVPYQESGPDADGLTQVTSGVLPALDTRVALRLPTGLDIPSLGDDGPRSSFEFFAGRRQQSLSFAPMDTRDLSAWRVGVRLLAEL